MEIWTRMRKEIADVMGYEEYEITQDVSLKELGADSLDIYEVQHRLENVAGELGLKCKAFPKACDCADAPLLEMITAIVG